MFGGSRRFLRLVSCSSMLHAEGIATRVVNATNSPLLGLPVAAGGSAPACCVDRYTSAGDHRSFASSACRSHESSRLSFRFGTKAAGNETRHLVLQVPRSRRRETRPILCRQIGIFSTTQATGLSALARTMRYFLGYLVRVRLTELATRIGRLRRLGPHRNLI